MRNIKRYCLGKAKWDLTARHHFTTEFERRLEIVDDPTFIQYHLRARNIDPVGSMKSFTAVFERFRAICKDAKGGIVVRVEGVRIVLGEDQRIYVFIFAHVCPD